VIFFVRDPLPAGQDRADIADRQFGPDRSTAAMPDQQTTNVPGHLGQVSGRRKKKAALFPTLQEIRGRRIDRPPKAIIPITESQHDQPRP